MSFYEKSREDNEQIHVSRNRPHAYPAHFHQNFEIFIVSRGEYSLLINGERITADDGSVVLIDSYDIHEYVSGSSSDDCVLIIPFRCLERFNFSRKNRRIKSHIIKDGKLCERLLGVVDSYLASDDVFIRDAAMQLILALLGENIETEDDAKRGNESGLLRKVLGFIQENYRRDITRSDIAVELGYTEAHISRVFNRYIGCGIKQYINRLRYRFIISERERGSDKTLTELIYDAGFGSEQTYYRYKVRHKEQ